MDQPDQAKKTIAQLEAALDAAYAEASEAARVLGLAQERLDRAARAVREHRNALRRARILGGR